MTNIHGKAAILAIGTELTTGQITNRNAAWISEKLVELGIEIVLHETVADDRPMIRQALDRCTTSGQFVFVTGGLGPTTDDFTRNVVAEWLNQPLEFHEPSWKWIMDRLGGFGIPVAESNRQQCYFPKNAEILHNPEGTAAGFKTEFGNQSQHLWVLPGPPREVSAIWETGIDLSLRKILPESRPLKLFTWQCMGKSEAELGEITEKALEGSSLLTGYRAHRPFVEVKVWCPEAEITQKQKWLEQLEKTIAPWVMTRQGEDLAQKLIQKLLRSESVEIMDAATGGALTSRLGAILREPAYQAQAETISMATQWALPGAPSEWVKAALEQADDSSLTLIIAGFTPDGLATIGLREEGRIYHEVLQSPYRKIQLLERMRYYAIEMALKRWGEWLDLATS